MEVRILFAVQFKTMDTPISKENVFGRMFVSNHGSTEVPLKQKDPKSIDVFFINQLIPHDNDILRSALKRNPISKLWYLCISWSVTETHEIEYVAWY